MILNAFLSRMEGVDSDQHDIISISVNVHFILAGQYFTIASSIAEAYKVQTRSATKAIAVQLCRV